MEKNGDVFIIIVFVLLFFSLGYSYSKERVLGKLDSFLVFVVSNDFCSNILFFFEKLVSRCFFYYIKRSVVEVM